jgi:hypothetical protein
MSDPSTATPSPELAFLDLFTVALIADPLPPAIADAEEFRRHNTPAVLPATASFPDAVRIVDIHERALVELGDDEWRHIDTASFNHMAFRSWLFALISHIESKVRQDIEEGGFWRTALSPERLRKAQELKAERQRRGQQVATIDCIPFGDAGKAAVRKGTFGAKLANPPSRRQVKSLVKQLESLRNNLAHVQDIVAFDWPAIVIIARNIDRIVGRA